MAASCVYRFCPTRRNHDCVAKTVSRRRKVFLVSKPGRTGGGDGAALTDGDVLPIAGPKVEHPFQPAAPSCRINPIANSATADYSGDAMPIGTCDSF